MPTGFGRERRAVGFRRGSRLSGHIRTALVDGSPREPRRMRDTDTSVRRIVARIAAEERSFRLSAAVRRAAHQLRSRLETLSGYAIRVAILCKALPRLRCPRDEATRIGSLCATRSPSLSRSWA